MVSGGILDDISICKIYTGQPSKYCKLALQNCYKSTTIIEHQSCTESALISSDFLNVL